MLIAGPANAISFVVPLAGVGDSYSLVPATFRTGTPPPAGRDEMLLAVDSPASEGVTLTHGQSPGCSMSILSRREFQLLALCQR